MSSEIHKHILSNFLPDESLPSSPQRKTTIIVSDNLPMPDILNTKLLAADSPTSLEIEIGSQNAIEDLDNLNSMPDDELHFDNSSDKFRNGSDSAIDDVYSNGNTSKEIVADLKPSQTLSEQPDVQMILNSESNEFNNENASSVEQPDNLSSSPSWNLDMQTPEPEVFSLSIQGDLNVSENASETVENDVVEESIGESTLVSKGSKRNSLDEPSPLVNQSVDLKSKNDDEVLDEFKDKLSLEFDADFKEFATFDDTMSIPPSEPVPATISSYPPEPCDNPEPDIEDDDDEFGEFSDFQQTTVVQTSETATQETNEVANVLLDNESIKRGLSSILATIFPSESQDNLSTEQKDNVKHDREQFINNFAAQLRDVEISNALHYQWAKSTSKTLLVKALGIDSRNIVNRNFNGHLTSLITFSIKRNSI